MKTEKEMAKGIVMGLAESLHDEIVGPYLELNRAEGAPAKLSVKLLELAWKIALAQAGVPVDLPKAGVDGNKMEVTDVGQ